jgi:hypothetical protein
VLVLFYDSEEGAMQLIEREFVNAERRKDELRILGEKCFVVAYGGKRKCMLAQIRWIWGTI